MSLRKRLTVGDSQRSIHVPFLITLVVTTISNSSLCLGIEVRRLERVGFAEMDWIGLDP